MVESGLTKPDTDHVSQICPLANDARQTITTVAGAKVFVNAKALQGLLSTIDARVKKVMLVISGVAVNDYSGVNNAAAGTWKVKLDAGAYAAPNPDSALAAGDWPCEVLGASHPFVFVFDITAIMTNIDGNLSIELDGAQSLQNNLITTINAYAVITWKF